MWEAASPIHPELGSLQQKCCEVETNMASTSLFCFTGRTGRTPLGAKLTFWCWD